MLLRADKQKQKEDFILVVVVGVVAFSPSSFSASTGISGLRVSTQTGDDWRSVGERTSSTAQHQYPRQ